MYQNFIISYLYEDQHVSGDTTPIIRSLKLHWQLLFFYNTVEGCWTCSWWTLSRILAFRSHCHTNLWTEEGTGPCSSVNILMMPGLKFWLLLRTEEFKIYDKLRNIHERKVH